MSELKDKIKELDWEISLDKTSLRQQYFILKKRANTPVYFNLSMLCGILAIYLFARNKESVANCFFYYANDVFNFLNHHHLI